jgi:hypothetical protein
MSTNEAEAESASRCVSLSLVVFPHLSGRSWPALPENEHY